MFFNEAFANNMTNSEAMAGNSLGGLVNNLIPLLIFIAIFYIILIRPQQKKQKEHEKEINSLKQNDKVVTAGGIYGTVIKVKEKSLLISIADGVSIEVVPDTVTLIKEEKKFSPEKESKKEAGKNILKTKK